MKLKPILLLCMIVIISGCEKILPADTTNQVANLNYSIDREMQFEIKPVHYFGYGAFLIHETPVSSAIYINPYKLKNGLPKADYILITSSEEDTCSRLDIEKILTNQTVIEATPDCKEKLKELPNSIIEATPGKTNSINNELVVIATDAYNTNPDRITYHPKEKNWVGYFIKYHERYYYYAGGTDILPFMKNMGKVHVAMLPINGKDSMSVDEAINVTYDIDAYSSVAMDYIEKTNNPKELEDKWMKGVQFGFPQIMELYK
jgi:L-ascorbate metabolism protein UlaG (beta-lactamase superfamily)